MCHFGMNISNRWFPPLNLFNQFLIFRSVLNFRPDFLSREFRILALGAPTAPESKIGHRLAQRL